MLKPFRGDLDKVNTAHLSDHFVNDQPVITPLTILDHRRSSPMKDAPWEVLVRW